MTIGRPPRLVGILALLLCLAETVSLHAAGEYRTADIGSLHVIIDTEWPEVLAPGYLPLRVELTNAGDARTIEIHVNGSRFFGTMGRTMRAGNLTVQRRLTVGRGDRIRFTMPLPVIAENENVNVSIRENGETIYNFGYSGFRVPSAAGQAGALIVAAASGKFLHSAAPWRRPMSRRGSSVIMGSSGGAPLLDVVMDPERLPTNWIAYTSLRAVLVGPEEWKGLQEDQRAALLKWTAAGGDLVLVDTDIAPLFPPLPSPQSGTHAYLFGRIHGLSAAEIAHRGLAAVLTNIDTLQDRNFALPANQPLDWNAMSARGFRLPIPGVEGVQARGFLLILMVFSVLIGPVNYWVLTRKRQQVLFVLTAPVLSVLFVFLLAGYVLASEGTGVYGRAATVTMLDQARKEAATRASVSMYSAGLIAAGRLQFSPEAAVVPIGTDGSGSVDRLTLDLTDGQGITSGVMQARAPSNFEQVYTRTARERLSFSQESDGISVVNGLGAPITMLLYRKNGQVYSLTTPLPAGTKGVLKPGNIDPTVVVPTEPPLARVSGLRRIVEQQPEGTYLAVLENSPFWEPGVGRLIERRSFHLVIGWVDGQP